MPIKLPSFRARRDVYPADLWTKCPTCETMLFNKQLDKAMRVCPTCGHHFRLSAATRLGQLLDPGTWAERDAGLQSVDRLGFVDQKSYPDRLAAAQAATGMRDAAVWGTAAIGGHPDRDLRHGLRVHGRLDGRRRRREGHPGRRARARGAHPAGRRQRVRRRPDAGGHAGAHAAGQDAGRARAPASRAACRSCRSCPIPTTGGVFASFAAVGDVNVAEPNALIGFAGSRVSAGTIAQELPPGFQRSEFLFEHGFIDRVVEPARAARRADRAAAPAPGPRRGDHRRGRRPRDRDARLPAVLVPVVAGREGRRADQRRRRRPRRRPPCRSDDDPRDDVWARVQLARNLARPRTLEFVDGDDRRLRRAARRPPVRRRRGDGRRTGPARRPPRRVVGQQKGADTDENIRRNFGMPHPEGYRKAMRIMELAERFGLPVITFVDVPGAHPGPESEERGIAEAIARSIGLMSRLRTPIVTVITGEGGSGGALAIAVGDVVIALENAVYSVISPEGCASILWRTADEAPAAALAMKMTAADQQALGVVDIVVPEPGDGRAVRPGRDRAAAQGDRRRPARRARCADASTSSSTRATAATGRWGPTLRRRQPSSRRRQAADWEIACGTCSTPVGAPSAQPSRRGPATNRRLVRRSRGCPNRSRPAIAAPTAPPPSVRPTTPRSIA